MKNNQLKILEMTHTMEESKISVDGLSSKLDTAEEKINYLEDQSKRSSLEATQKDKEMGEHQTLTQFENRLYFIKINKNKVISG